MYQLLGLIQFPYGPIYSITLDLKGKQLIPFDFICTPSDDGKVPIRMFIDLVDPLNLVACLGKQQLVRCTCVIQ